MIKVEHLTKRYAGITAIEDISFHVGKGEIVGFLGPNGAGKSTTMRILSCFIPPTAGTAQIAGYDVFKQSRAVREHIGYMPENVPLYSDMRVNEYLRYRAALKGVRGRKIRERLQDVVELCGLQEVERKLIGALSKGYRQRVGLADAMIHEPDLLILDEPTIGLDPNQIRQVRQLIKNLRRHHTILLSTHILSEVEMTCNRVIIINRGKIEAMDTPQNLHQRLQGKGEIIAEIRGPTSSELLHACSEIPELENANASSDGDWIKLRVQVNPDEDLREAIFDLCISKHWQLRELTSHPITLEDVFAEITQGEE